MRTNKSVIPTRDELVNGNTYSVDELAESIIKRSSEFLRSHWNPIDMGVEILLKPAEYDDSRVIDIVVRAYKMYGWEARVAKRHVWGEPKVVLRIFPAGTKRWNQ